MPVTRPVPPRDARSAEAAAVITAQQNMALDHTRTCTVEYQAVVVGVVVPCQTSCHALAGVQHWVTVFGPEGFLFLGLSSARVTDGYMASSAATMYDIMTYCNSNQVHPDSGAITTAVVHDVADVSPQRLTNHLYPDQPT